MKTNYYERLIIKDLLKIEINLIIHLLSAEDMLNNYLSISLFEEFIYFN